MFNMWLPTLTPKALDEFRDLLRGQFGVTLEEQQLNDVATRALHLTFLLTYGNRYLCSEINGE